jgi:glucose/arabinose dehydrogenase
MRNLARSSSLVALLVSSIAGCGDDGGTSGSGGAPTTAGPTTAVTTGGGAGGDGGAGGGGVGGAGGSSGVGGGGPIRPMFDCAPPTDGPLSLDLEEVASGLAAPVFVTFAPDNPDRLYVVEQDGLVRVLEDGVVAATPFLDVKPLLRGGLGGEEGLLGLAFHPDYAENGRFFVYFTAKADGAQTVMEFARSEGDPLTADPTPTQLALSEPTSAGNDPGAENKHQAGWIGFGADGLLYIAIGDGGAELDPGCDAQKTTHLLGKIVRLDVDANATRQGYPAAPGNPNGSKILHLGLRNPWRASHDACTGDLYIGDVGQNGYEEISFAASDAAGLNFGWPMREGLHDHPHDCVNPSTMLTDPIAEYSHAQGLSITGGYVYRGSAIPALRGSYLYGDFLVGSIARLRYENGMLAVAPEDTGLNVSTLSSFGQDGHGELYVTSLGGTVSKIVPK